MSAGSRDALKFSGNERGAVFNGRGSWRGRISGALIQGVVMVSSSERSNLITLTLFHCQKVCEPHKTDLAQNKVFVDNLKFSQFGWSYTVTESLAQMWAI